MRAHLSDQELVRNYISGDELAFETLVNRHQQQVFSKIMFIVRDVDLANDLFQETFIKVVNTLKGGKYNEEGKFLPWVLRIAHNLSIDHFRRGKKMPMVRSTDEYDVFDTIRHPDDNVEQVFAQEDIRQALGKLVLALPSEQEEVVRMRIERDLSFKEIAEETGVSINTALGRMRYALINLRRMMEEKGVELTVN